MDYFQWCERVLSTYLEAAQSSLEVRRDGFRADQVARSIFGPEAVERDSFITSSEWEGLRQAIKDLDDKGCIWTDDNYYGDEPHLPAKITREGEEFLEDEERRWIAWWATCTAAPNFKQELETRTKDQKAEFVKDVLGLVNTKASGERWLIVGFDDKSQI